MNLVAASMEAKIASLHSPGRTAGRSHQPLSKQRNLDSLVKSPKFAFPFILAKAGIPYFHYALDAGVRRHDASATFHGFINLTPSQRNRSASAVFHLL